MKEHVDVVNDVPDFHEEAPGQTDSKVDAFLILQQAAGICAPDPLVQGPDQARQLDR